MNLFEYFEPKNLEEASALLSKYGHRAEILAAGTDLIVAMRDKKKCPKYVINIKSIPNLRYIKCDENDELKIGSLSTIRDIEEWPAVQEKFPVLKQAASLLGTPQIRNRGTVGGNLCNASPAADMATPLIALDAKAGIYGMKGNRVIDLRDFFVGPGKTVLADSEILEEVKVPAFPFFSGGCFLKLGRTKMADLSVINVAVTISVGNDGKRCKDARIAIGAVAPTPIRAKKAEVSLIGNTLRESLLEEASALAAEESKPINDVRGTKWYRKEMVKVLTRRAIETAVKEAVSNYEKQRNQQRET